MVNMKTKHFETSIAKLKLDISKHFNTDDNNLCRNQSLLNNGNKTMINCPFNTQFILKKSQSKSKSSTTREPNKEVETTTKIPRCGVQDGPLSYVLETQWKKKSFTWKLLDGYHPSYGTGRTRAQIHDAFNDWARYAPLTFREVSQDDEADFELAFIHRVHDAIRRFDGPGGTLAYAYLPPSGVIRFEAEEPWKDDYDNKTTGFNLHIVATHEIGHALGLSHSNDPTSIMFERYQLFQPHELLPKDVSNNIHFSFIDRDGIQALYRVKSTPRKTKPTTTRTTTYPTTTRRRRYPTSTRRRTYPTTTRRITTQWPKGYKPTSSWRTVNYWPTTVWWTTRYSPTATRRTVRYRSTTTSRPPSTWRTMNYWPTTVWWATRYSPATTQRTVRYRSTTTSRKTRYRTTTTTQWTTKYNPTVTMRTVRYKTKTTLKPTKYKSTTIKTTKKTKTTTTTPTRKTKITIPRSKTTKTSGSTWRYTTKRSIRTTTTSQPNKEWVRLWPTWTILYPKSRTHSVRYQLGSTQVSKKQTVRTTTFKKTKTTTTLTTAKIQKKLITTLPAIKLKVTTTTTTKSIPNKSKLTTVSKSTETTTMLPLRKITTTIERLKTLSTKTVAVSKITTKLLKRTSTIASEKAKILTTNPVIVTKNNTNVSIRNTKADTTRKTTITMAANKTVTNTLMKTITTQPTIIIGRNEQVQLNFDKDHCTNIYQHEP
ncbi:unnamed protein product [Adineta steineri]|uniref:Peptidase metallopeptidase domain-containing protein n=1 Tax=Adineta steineri TaxID=433720 RepID=A0A818I6Y1_9BILA|nr:unnamed protein product [Adineta steineri]CAF3521190.1 unnamed protein product [Adineta steineri]